MKKFKFKFEAVEKIRKIKEDEALRGLGRAQRSLLDAQIHRDNLLRDLDESLKRREALAKNSSSVVSYQIENDFISGTKIRILYAENAIKKAKKGVERALQNYLNHRRQTRTIEMLREKDFAEYRKERNRQEQKKLDEIVVMRAGMAAFASAIAEETNLDSEAESLIDFNSNIKNRLNTA